MGVCGFRATYGPERIYSGERSSSIHWWAGIYYRSLRGRDSNICHYYHYKHSNVEE